jgi:hypothetical protein
VRMPSFLIKCSPNDVVAARYFTAALRIPWLLLGGATIPD